MEVKVTKDNVFITEENKIHVGEYKVNKINFNFSEEYTSDLVINAIFTFNEKSYQTSIINNECNIPAEVLASDGEVIFGVYAYKVNDDELELRYSPFPAYFSVLNGSYNPTAEESQEITPTQFEQYMQALQDGLNEIQELIEGIGDIEDLPNRLVPAGGASGQVLSKNSDADYDVKWVNSSSTGGTTNYEELTNKPQINGVTLEDNKSLADLGIKQTYTADDITFTDGETFQDKYDAGELTGPKGDTGDTGPQGVQGETGPAGQDGANATINGQNTLNILAGTNITLDQQGTDLTINATGGSGGGSTYTAGTNIEITEDNVINNTIPYNSKNEETITESIAIGYGATISGVTNCLAIGATASAGSSHNGNSTAVGVQSKANSTGCVAVGVQANATGLRTVAIGETCYATSNYALAIGSYSRSQHVHSIAIGRGASTTQTNQFIIGGTNSPINVMNVVTEEGTKEIATTDLIEALETRIATLEAKITELEGGN